MAGLPGFDVLGVSALLALAGGGATAVDSCARVPPPPAVTVHVVEENTKTDAARSAEYLAVLHGDTPGGLHPGGLMRGDVSVEHRIGFRRRQDRGGGFGCLSVETVDITIRLDPSIYVASEYRGDSCLSREILNHETLHVAVDRQIAAKYRSRIRDGLNMLFSESPDYASGVVLSGDIAKARKRMEAVMENAVGVLFSGLQRERAETQARLDTPYEYARILKACRRG